MPSASGSSNGCKARKKKLFIRTKPDEFDAIQKNADQYAGGNISKWMRDRAQFPMISVSIEMDEQQDSPLIPTIRQE